MNVGLSRSLEKCLISKERKRAQLLSTLSTVLMNKNSARFIKSYLNSLFCPEQQNYEFTSYPNLP